MAAASSALLSPPVCGAHDVLRVIRRVRTVAQLQDAYDPLLSFVRTCRAQLIERAEGAEGESAASKSNPRTAALNSSTAEAQWAVSQLKQVSLLCGAFCRRIEYVLRSTYTYADVDETAQRGPASAQVSTLVASITSELAQLNRTGINKLLSAASSELPVFWSDTPCTPVDCVLSYAAGEVNDYRLYRRIRAQSYLQELLAQPQWSSVAVTHVIVALNETLSSSPDAFDLCGDDEAVEATCIVTPLRDPITQTVIAVPARGVACTHVEMFDVEGFIQATQQRSVGTVDVGGPCPLCSKFVGLPALRVDRRAMAAMQAYTAATGTALTAHNALEWNTAGRTVTVVQSRRATDGALAEQAETEEEEEERKMNSRRGSHSAAPAEAATKKRRIEIGGHVLYAD